VKGLEGAGFATIQGLIPEREVRELLSSNPTLEHRAGRAGMRHALRQPGIMKLAEDPRLLAVARRVLGPAATPFRATLFDKSPSANWLVVWHQDTALPLVRRETVAGWGPWSRKAGIDYAHAPPSALEQVLALRLHLDDATEDNGPLRVLPGTHRRGVLTDEEIQALAGHLAPIPCVVARGGALVMRPLLVHSSSKSKSAARRRVLHIEYAASMRIADGLELAVA
jgi:ectoine hydroxylase-related dioxygenase (phytanoyl-CoA dioxygenase family)